MIKVTKLRAVEPELVVNADLIETVEATPDTVITLTTGHKFIVQESVDTVVALVIDYHRKVLAQRPAAGAVDRHDLGTSPPLDQ